ncbi:TIGR00269 family protein [Candidatus Woesearchaeota archaeon]|nr:TIGR00269 family protein [Candidatus Woesearchaeota archaeon]
MSEDNQNKNETCEVSCTEELTPDIIRMREIEAAIIEKEESSKEEKEEKKELSDSKFVEYFEKKVRNTIRKYELFDKKSKVLIAVSGGKDSTVCAYLLKKLGYNVEALTIDAVIGCYTKENLKNIKRVCEKYDIKLNVLSFREQFGMSLCYIRSILLEKGRRHSSCMICGILKRYLLNKFASENKFEYLATGHNLDDEAQAFIMNVFRNDFKLAKRQGAKPGNVTSDKFVTRVKPLYLMSEEEIIRYSKIMEFPVYYGICPCSVDAYRREYKVMLDEFEKRHPNVKYNILKFQEQMKASLIKEEGVKVGSCENCGEPSAGTMCKACQIFDDLRNAKKE